jgi:hypothetical protein
VIDQRFIDSARQIHYEYLRISNELDKKQDLVLEMADYIKTKMGELEFIRDNSLKNAKTKEDAVSISQELHDKLKEIEDKENSLNKNIKFLTDQMEKLREEELDLQKKVQDKYPDKSLESLKKEIHSRL